jgi:type II restriction/modification system DNA methylase subunit YeeA
MPTLKPDKTSRFDFINPNGFQLNASGGTFAEFLLKQTEYLSIISVTLSINLMDTNI